MSIAFLKDTLRTVSWGLAENACCGAFTIQTSYGRNACENADGFETITISFKDCGFVD